MSIPSFESLPKRARLPPFGRGDAKLGKFVAVFCSLGSLYFLILLHDRLFPASASAPTPASAPAPALAPTSAAPVVQHEHHQRQDIARASMPERNHSTFCGASPARCIYDLGFNVGGDTAFYLSQPNAHVVAVEANPTLSEEALKKEPFKSAFAEGRLKLLSVGITPSRDEGALTFWVNDFTEYSSFKKSIGCRKMTDGRPVLDENKHTVVDESTCKEITVPTMTCAQLVEQFGTPDYMKVDIEGIHVACVRSLKDLDKSQRPEFLSMEGCAEASVQLLKELGYSAFKVVDQYFNSRNGRTGSSGPWGSEAIDVTAGTRWRESDQIVQEMPYTRRKMSNGKLRNAWYDLHARKA